MKFLITVGLLFCACSSAAPRQATDDLNVRVHMTTGEHSRDSSSQTTTLTIAPGADAIVWGQSYSGRRRGTPPDDKTFKLSPTDKAGLLKLIRDGRLLVTNSIKLPDDSSSYSYFSISLDISLDGKKGAITISGPRTAAKVKEEKVYQETLALVGEIYRIIHAQDKTVYFEELVR